MFEGHAGNVGNERCDTIARAFANGRSLSLQQTSWDMSDKLTSTDTPAAAALNSTAIQDTPQISSPSLDVTPMDSPTPSSVTLDDLPREIRVIQLRNLVETLRIADEIAAKSYLITSSELADLMDIHASAVTSRGDEWRWRNWIVSRVRREGNQILWELERGDQVGSIPDLEVAE